MRLRYPSAFLTLATFDLNRLVLFYQLFLGQDPVSFMPDRYAEFHLSHLRLGLFFPKPQHQAEFGSPAGSAFSLCLEVEQLEGAIAHFTATYQTLQTAGQWTGPPPLGSILTPSHGREIYAYDPDGNRLILHEAIAVNRDYRVVERMETGQ